MNKIFLDKLLKKKDKNFKVEPIFYNEKNKILLNSFLKKQNFLSASEALSIIEINFLKQQ